VQADVTNAGTLLLSTLGNFSVSGLAGADEDVCRFAPGSLGSNTAASFSMMLDVSLGRRRQFGRRQRRGA